VFIDSDPRAAWAAPLIDAQVEDPAPEAEVDAPTRDPGQAGSRPSVNLD
jgi:hypothetical protein